MKSYLPWEWAWHNGIFSGSNSVWLYKAMDPPSLLWAPETALDAESDRLKNTLTELASVSLATRWSRFARRRKFHLLSVKYFANVDTSEDTGDLGPWLRTNVYDHRVPRRAVFLGVELRPSALMKSAGSGPSGERETLMDIIGKVSDKAFVDSPESLEAYKQDIERVEKTLGRNGFRNPTSTEMSVMQSWYENSPGDGMCLVSGYPNYLEVEQQTGENTYWQFSAVSGWQNELPPIPWFAVANSGTEHAWVISARGELEKSTATRKRVTAQRHKLDETRTQTEQSMDYERSEDENLAWEMAELDEYLGDPANADEPVIAKFSMIMGRRLFIDERDPSRWEGEHTQSYSDELNERFAVKTISLPYQQVEAALETMPCAPVVIGDRRPFMHYVGIGVVAEAGMTSMSELGDKKGAHMGYVLPDETPCRLDFGAASAENMPPMMLVAGQPGSGKTVVSQALLHQASVAGVNAIFVNPKGADTLKPLLSSTGGEHVVMGATSTPGSLDPFRFADTDTAVYTAIGFLDVLIPNMDEMKIALIEEGLRSRENPTCFMDAVQGIKSKEQREELDQLRRSNPVLGLCMGTEGGEFRLGGKKANEFEQGVLLVEFGGDVQLPTAPTKISEMSRAERFGVGAVSLLMQAAMQLIVASRRGQKESGTGSFLVIDEAWIMLSSSYLASAYMESLARLGRSLDVTVILATQRVSDVINAGLDEYLSRVMLMKLTSAEEQRLGLELLGLEHNDEFSTLLRESGSQRYKDPYTGEMRRVPPVALMKDLSGRVGALKCEFREELLDLYSTNPEDRRELLQRTAEQ